ncbi:hypothetical protein EON66_00955 [archaeon]|nr:MAG: hypothetical protein EON66_00955 [archaeon]
MRGHELRDGEEEEEEEEPVRQCTHWRSLISTTFVKCGYIDRRQVDADTAETLTQVESTQSGSVTGATRKGFQLGPRARQVIGLPTVLALIESIRGSSIRPDELHIAYGREDGFVQYALDVEPEDGVVVGNPILAAGAAAGRR